MRQMVSKSPLILPYFLIASIAYAEQVGVNLQWTWVINGMFLYNSISLMRIFFIDYLPCDFNYIINVKFIQKKFVV